jgi:phosphotransferase system IIB component
MIGCLVLVPNCPLRRADNATAGTAPIVIRCWVKDFESIGPTRFEFATQSETYTGPISSVTHSFGRAAEALEKVPIIGSVAGMAKDGFDFVRNIAHLFGFSRPNKTTSNPMYVLASQVGLTDNEIVLNACSYSKDRAVPLDACDIDGCDYDNMAISRMVSKSSLCRVFSWNTVDPIGQVLLDMPVDPMVIMYDTINTFYPTALAGVCLPFKYWTGSLVYEVLVVSSKFHSGTIRCQYDPGLGRGYNTATPTQVEDTTWPIAATENCLIKISPGGRSIISINFTFSRPWQTIGDFVTTMTPSLGSGDYAHCTGRLRFMVENPLQVPLSTSGVTVLVYVKGGPDFQVFGNTELVPRYGLQVPASAGDTEDIVVNPPKDPGFRRQSALSADNVITRCSFGGSSPAREDSAVISFGEQIVSLRALLKRFVPLGYVQATSDTNNTHSVYKEITACFEGLPTDLSVLAGASAGITYFDYSNAFRWFRIAFVGYRGGLRFTIADCHETTDQNITASDVNNPARYLMYSSSFSVTNLAANITGIRGNMPQIAGVGSALCNLNRHENNFFEIPDYKLGKFRYCQDLGGSVSVAGISNTAEYVALIVNKRCTDATKCIHAVSVAAADDFSFVRFQGFPAVKIIP